jgi:hypothetical protein
MSEFGAEPARPAHNARQRQASKHTIRSSVVKPNSPAGLPCATMELTVWQLAPGGEKKEY